MNILCGIAMIYFGILIASIIIAIRTQNEIAHRIVDCLVGFFILFIPIATISFGIYFLIK